MAGRDLRRVRRAADKLEAARVTLRDAILLASKSGESIRDIVPYTDLKASRVHDLLQEARDLEHGRGEEES